ncbi:hypothetical protein GSY71_07740 [Pusillimonas sp. TS35]|uniref:ChaN family lipoprotein n=1 Tax=Paracandidimonas lactea TaxID=2895524 RepID=UPI001368B856|nr:ChaN family lipoprotein [Paracandidimonas lactea]MYN13038.1 hypothetical protein [Pusillimonas sp. TS35]
MRYRLSAAAGTLPMLLAACAGPAGHTDAGSLITEMPRYSVVLLGEIHDNAAGHAFRQAALEKALRAGWRPVLAMEQFDRERQADLDRAVKTCADAACVIAAASGARGWNWDFYTPLITLALQYKLPLMAANLSRADAARIVRDGLPAVFDADALRALGLQPAPAAALMRTQVQEVATSHCGMLPATLHQPMATAQVARDAVMAHAIRTAAAVTGRPVVLLAGDGHVRKDIGVPYWLARGTPPLAPGRSLSVGILESVPAPGQYDRVVRVAPQARPDPCAELKAGVTQGKQ